MFRLPRLFLLLALTLPALAGPRPVTVAAAADLRWALEEVCQCAQKAHPGLQVKVTYGSSGQFYAQLVQRAPFDLFLSADLDYARKLKDQGLGGTPFQYALGKLVLWVPAESRLDLERLGLAAVLDPSIRHLALGNPAHAPYGKAAEAALTRAGLAGKVQAKQVLGENIAQAAQFVQTGVAEAGLLALSLAKAPELASRGRYWVVPQELYPPLQQGGLILAWAKDPEAAGWFREFLLGPEGRAILKRYGFE